jgi:hypothetical protein
MIFDLKHDGLYFIDNKDSFVNWFCHVVYKSHCGILDIHGQQLLYVLVKSQQ